MNFSDHSIMAIIVPNHQEPSQDRKQQSRRFTPIPEEFISQVNERSDILGIIGRSVQLKKSGSNSWVGRCPFHSEKTPSFTVTPNKGMYHCFGCGVSGGSIQFLVEHDGIPFRDAVKELALSNGMQLPAESFGERQNTPENPAIDIAPLYSAMEMAAKYFRHILIHDESAKAYLRDRGVNQESVNKYLIGFAPNEWRGLEEAFKNYSDNEAIVQCGLVREKESVDANGEIRKRRYDTFRARVMFPVRNTRGRVCAFGGRIVVDTEAKESPKYINSPESPIFDKSNMLFGLYEAREAIRRKKMAIIVEGYLDVVMLSQCGVQYAVACMGTGMTRQHVEKIFTQTDTVVFSFDGDAAGRKAAWRALHTCIPVVEDKHDIRFLLLPQGKDPDDLAKEEGSEAFEKRILKAPSLSEFLISELRTKHNNLTGPEDRARFASEASEIASRLGYRTKLRKLLLQAISDESRTPGSVIRSMQVASSNRSGKKTLWQTLSEAVLLVPEQAFNERDMILELLDKDDPEEKRFSDILTSLSESNQATTHASETKVLLARDTVNNALNIIMEYRESQIKEIIRTQFSNGEISEEEYMRLMMEH